MKKKIILVIILVICIAFFSGITYSFFNSNVSLKSSNQGIASFIFETNKVDYIDLDLYDLIPGEEKSYSFFVTNSKNQKISDVTVEYQLKIRTYHFIPLVINLYKEEEGKEVFIGTCDETTNRNSDNEIVCNMPIEKLEKKEEQQDEYKLKIEFPIEYNYEKYSNLVDYIRIEVDSWQKL